MNSPAVIDLPSEVSEDVILLEPELVTETPPSQTLLGRAFGWVSWSIGGAFCLASLIACLTALARVPILQLIAFGYLLDVSGRLSGGAKVRDCLPKLREAGQIGLVVLTVFVAALPIQLFAHLQSVSVLISPEASGGSILRWVSIALAALGVWYVVWAVARGGRLRHFLWPQPIRALREAWRPSTYAELPDRLWEFTKSLELRRYFWLGLRGLIGTLIWLIPAMVIIAANRNGETGAAGLLGATAFVALGIVMMYLPMLQAHFAAEDRFRAIFEVRRIRRLFCYAPWAWFLAMTLGLVLLPIPLYLLKIEATPEEVTWLPILVCITFLLPARIVEGLALRRARRIADESYSGGEVKPSGMPMFLSRMTARYLIAGIVVVYLAFVTASQYTSWDGLTTWVQQHAVLIPIPFLSGV
ncbi:MAG: DUF4013 domain-containing protein [Planctomycetota bacterium]